MSLKENLQKKLRIERLARKITATMSETPGRMKLDKDAVKELLGLTDFEQVKARDLTLYVRPLQGGLNEVIVLDNELPLYRSTVADVAMRKTPHWKEMLSIGNIIKVLDDKDVVASKGRQSLARIRARAVARLDLSYGREDLERLLRDAQVSLGKKSLSGVREVLDLFSELLGFQRVVLEILEAPVQLFARLKEGGATAPIYEDLVFLDEERVDVQLFQGEFSPGSDRDLARILQCLHGECPAEAQGERVFAYFVELAWRQAEKRRAETARRQEE